MTNVTIRLPKGEHQSGLFVRVLSFALLLLLTPTISFASHLILDPDQRGTLVPQPFRGGHGFRFDFAEQTGMFIIEELDRSGAAQMVVTLDFDGTIFGEPSWIIEIATSSGLVSLNEAFGDLVLPPGVGPDGTVDSQHNTVPSGGGIWSWDAITVTQMGGETWVNTPGGIVHTSTLPPLPSPADPPALVAFTNQTGGVVDIQSLVPEPSSAALIALGFALGPALLAAVHERHAGHCTECAE